MHLECKCDVKLCIYIYTTYYTKHQQKVKQLKSKEIKLAFCDSINGSPNKLENSNNDTTKQYNFGFEDFIDSLQNHSIQYNELLQRKGNSIPYRISYFMCYTCIYIYTFM